MRFEFITKHRGRPVPAPVATRRSVPGYAQASSPTTGRTARGASGMIFWPKAYHAACIASSG